MSLQSPHDCDVVLIGTGIAPLIAANHLLFEGKSVLILNPDRDFFLENSELPLDPLPVTDTTIEQIQKNGSEQALSILRPDFPGAVEFWNPKSQKTEDGYRDPTAPYLREKERIWITEKNPSEISIRGKNWDHLENLYVRGLDHEMNPQILDGLTATHRFPGIKQASEQFQGLSFPKVCDVDVTRYQIGLIEFLRDRLGPQKIASGVTQIETTPGGIRFRIGKNLNSAEVNLGVLVFWTPRLTGWIQSLAKRFDAILPIPTGIRLWERWTLLSREDISPDVVGTFENMTIWADYEGRPPEHPHFRLLNALRSGPQIKPEPYRVPEDGMNRASSDSFSSLRRLCTRFLGWESFTIRGLSSHAIFEWEEKGVSSISESNPKILVLRGSDGTLIDVVDLARKAADHLIAPQTKKRPMNSPR